MSETDVKYSDSVLAAVDAGRKIAAIKQLRDETGLGLKEAKQQIDRLQRQRQPQHHSGAHSMPEAGGASGLIKLIVAVAVGLLIYRYFVAGG